MHHTPDITPILLSHGYDVGDWDIELLIKRLSRRPSLYRAISDRDSDRITRDMIGESCLGVGMVASQCSYRRPGEPWCLPGVRAGSQEAVRTLDRLDTLRDLVTRSMPRLHELQSPYIGKGIRRAYALMSLALDAVGDQQADLIIGWSGIWPETGDPQGDAQLACEDEHGTTTSPQIEIHDQRTAHPAGVRVPDAA